MNNLKLYNLYFKRMSFIKIKDPRKREELIKDFIETRKRIKDGFISQKVGEAEYQTGLTKLFKPVTETQKATAKEITEAQKATAERIEKGLLPIKEGIESLTMLPIEAGDPIPAIEPTKEQLTTIGDIATKYLKSTFGRKATQADIIPGDKEGTLFKIGKTPKEIKNNDLYINGIEGKITGTPGLWELLTSQGIPDKNKYGAVDLSNYIMIMTITKATRQDFNKDNKRIPGNEKMNKLIKPFVSALEEGEDKLIIEINKHFGIKDEDEEDENGFSLFDDPQPGTSGTNTDGEGIKGKGFKFLSSDPNALIDRFDLLLSSKKAGHTGVRNEIISILDELKRQGVIKTNEYKKLNSIIKK